MGLFSGLAKLAGKVVKTGLSVATGGKSDAVLKVAKGIIGAAKPKSKPAMTMADYAAVLDYQPDVTTGRTIYEDGVAMPGLKVKKKAAPKKKKAAPKKAKAAPKKAAAKKRAPPKGGLDLKALSASWKAAGKPGTWQGWIKANK